MFQVIQQATDRELPDSRACDTDSRLVTLSKRNGASHLIQLTVSSCSMGELFNLTADSLLK